MSADKTRRHNLFPASDGLKHVDLRRPQNRFSVYARNDDSADSVAGWAGFISASQSHRLLWDARQRPLAIEIVLLLGKKIGVAPVTVDFLETDDGLVSEVHDLQLFGDSDRIKRSARQFRFVVQEPRPHMAADDSSGGSVVVVG